MREPMSTPDAAGRIKLSYLPGPPARLTVTDRPPGKEHPMTADELCARFAAMDPRAKGAVFAYFSTRYPEDADYALRLIEPRPTPE